MGVPSQALTWHDAIMLCSKILYFPQEPAYNRLWAADPLGERKRPHLHMGYLCGQSSLSITVLKCNKRFLVFPSKDVRNCFVCVHCVMLVQCGYKLSCTLTSKSYFSIFQLLPVCLRQDFCRAMPETQQKTSPVKKRKRKEWEKIITAVMRCT